MRAVLLGLLLLNLLLLSLLLLLLASHGHLLILLLVQSFTQHLDLLLETVDEVLIPGILGASDTGRAGLLLTR